jgi:hypothetical protein
MVMTSTKELRCCLGCGRDTRGDYCPQCIGHYRGSAGKGRGYRARRVPEPPLEDDYSEESGPDDICEDNSASVSRVS